MMTFFIAMVSCEADSQSFVDSLAKASSQPCQDGAVLYVSHIMFSAFSLGSAKFLLYSRT